MDTLHLLHILTKSVQDIGHCAMLCKQDDIESKTLGPVVRKSVNANPGLKVKRGFDFCCIKAYIRANILWGFTLVKGKTEGNKI